MSGAKKMTLAEIRENVQKVLKMPLFVIKFVYKSGHVELMPFHKFSINGSSYEWESPCSTISEKMDLSESILCLKPENIESIFQYESFSNTAEFISEDELFEDRVRILKANDMLVENGE